MVVLMSLWSNSFWIVRMSEPDWNKWVVNEWRKVWQLAGLVSPAARTAFFTARMPLSTTLRRVHRLTGSFDQLHKDDRTRRRQRPPRPPQMQRGRMPMPDGLLPRASRIDRIQRQGDFDEFAGGFDGKG